MVRIGFLVALVCCTSPAYAWQIGNTTSHSAEYTRMLSRNASLDADAVFYNPAGLTTLMKVSRGFSPTRDFYSIARLFTAISITQAQVLRSWCPQLPWPIAKMHLRCL